MASKATGTGGRERGRGGRGAQPPVEEPLTKQLFGEALYTVQQVALALGVTAETVRDWIKAGDLIGIRFGQKEYRIAASALLQYKQDREEEAKLEYEARRAQRRAEAEVARLRIEDPLSYWQWTLCPMCGKTKVLTTRHQRKDGDWMCEECEALPWQARERSLKDCADRTARMRAVEYNAEAGVESGEPPRYVVYICGVCAEPSVKSIHQILDPDYYPDCSHDSSLFRTWSEVERQGRYDPRVLAALAELERQIRTVYWAAEHKAPPEDSPWGVVQCEGCHAYNVVFEWDGRSAAVPSCRDCRRASKARQVGMAPVPAGMADADSLDDVPF